MRIVLRAMDTEEDILSAGGRWDRRGKCFDGESDKAVVLHLHDGQLEAARWFRAWLAGYLSGKHGPETERVWSVLFAGGRRGGKSDLAVKILAAFAVAAAGSNIWAVSPAQAETQELADVLAAVLPGAWYTYRDDPHWRYTLANGSRIWLRSGHKPETLKRGRADLVLLNEAQRFPQRAYATVRPPTADTGGLVLLAANPPEDPIGDWLMDFYDDAKAGRRRSRLFEFDPRRNPTVTRESLEDLEHEVDDRTFRREILGEFIPTGDRVLYAWSSRLHVQPAPAPDANVTAQFTQRHFGAPASAVVGMDFQLSPFMAAVVFRAFTDPDHPTAASPALWAVDEVVVEHGNEDDLVDELEQRGYDGKSTVVVADASGEWQDAERTRGRGSFDMLRKREWRRVYPPDDKSRKNPLIAERVAVTNARLRTADGKIHVYSVPANAQLNRALREWENKHGRPNRSSPHAHLSDAFSYPLWRFFPRRATPAPVEYEAIPGGRGERARDFGAAFGLPDEDDDE